MEWMVVVGIVVLAALAGVLVRRRERRLTLTQHTMRCPVHDCRVSLAVRTDPVPHPRRRYVDVAACSLVPSVVAGQASRTGYFPGVSPYLPFLYEVNPAPQYAEEPACAKVCLGVLNAAEGFPAARPLHCMSGMSDALELARETQPPGVMRQIWFHSS
jgi:hypothetical protein